MRVPLTKLGLIAASIVGLALPAAAGAEYLVPPGNSAATQYTETLPTAGGHSNAEKPNEKKNRTPSNVLGAETARQLEDQGEAGREAAEFAAETAPGEEVTPPQPRHGKTGKPRHRQEKQERDDSQPQAGAGTDTHGGSGPNGSSGLGEVIGQATGSPSGQLGLLLPLAIVGAAAWALAFFLRQRKRPTS